MGAPATPPADSSAEAQLPIQGAAAGHRPASPTSAQQAASPRGGQQPRTRVAKGAGHHGAGGKEQVGAAEAKRARRAALPIRAQLAHLLGRAEGRAVMPRQHRCLGPARRQAWAGKQAAGWRRQAGRRTWPPAASMRARSSGRCGRWSSVRGCTRHAGRPPGLGEGTCRPSTARESPHQAAVTLRAGRHKVALAC